LRGAESAALDLSVLSLRINELRGPQRTGEEMLIKKKFTVILTDYGHYD
jgi:hypothetical protein